MATAAQRYLSNLFNLETNKSRNDKLLKLNMRDMGRIHTHISNSTRWISCKMKDRHQSFYNPELDVEFSITYSKKADNEGKPQAALIVSKRDVNNNSVYDLLTHSWDVAL